MNKSRYFKVERPKVVSETIDGEVVIVNLELGSYYSLLETATQIWEKIEKGTYYEEIIASLSKQYAISLEELTTCVNDFLEKLKQENLIIELDNNVNEPSNLDGSVATISEEIQKQTFVSPILEKYTDMQDLLLLDPIHEVEEEGWPKAKSELI
jgi:hypothetical protein